MDEFDWDAEDPDAARRGAARDRTCLMCGEIFPSAWAGERICRQCKSQSRWRSGQTSLAD